MVQLSTEDADESQYRGQLTSHRPIIHGLVELKVPRARQLMREHKARVPIKFC